MSLAQILDLVSKVGLGGLLAGILYGSYKRVWVWGSELKKCELEKEEWKELALSGTNVADAMTEYAIQQRLRYEAASLRDRRRGRLTVEEEKTGLQPRNRKLRV